MKIFIPLLIICSVLSININAHCATCSLNRSDKNNESHHDNKEIHSHDETIKEKESIKSQSISTIKASTESSDEEKYQSLNLTEKQEEKYNKIVDKYTKKIKKLEESFTDEIKKLLTDEQYELFIKNNEIN